MKNYIVMLLQGRQTHLDMQHGIPLDFTFSKEWFKQLLVMQDLVQQTLQ